MSRSARCIVSFFLLLVIGILGIAQAAKKPPAKVAPKRIVKGTTQLGGEDHAKLGETYTLGKAAPINVTLKSVEYSVSPTRIGDDVIATNADEKLLILRYKLHNPNKQDFGLSWGTLEIFGVDANDKNWRYCANVAMEGTGERCYMSLKPGQKTDVYTLIVVPAMGEMPKVVIQSRDRLVLRYDLKGKAKPFAAPIADPADPTGATARASVPAEMGVFYPFRDLDAKLDSVAFTDTPIKDRPAGKGKRYLTASVSVKNSCFKPRSMSWGTFTATLVDEDGGETRCASDRVLRAHSDEQPRQDIQPGAEINVRYVFEVPANLYFKSLNIRASQSRTYIYDISAVK